MNVSMMKKSILSAAAALVCCVIAWGQAPISVSDVCLWKENGRMQVSMTVNLSGIESVEGAVSFAPMIVKDSVSVALAPIGLYSRNRFYAAAREARSDSPFDGVPYTYYLKEKPDTLYYSDSAGYLDWMGGAALRIDTLYFGCCDRMLIRKEGKVLAMIPEEEPIVEPPVEEPPIEVYPPVVEEYQGDDVQVAEAEEPVDIPIADDDSSAAETVFQVYVPYYMYMQPEAETIVKERAISGEAYVVFKSGATDVDAEYKDNEAELQKIRATVDSVRVDPDISITSIVLRGYSSPDGSFSVNQELSEKRVQAIRAYVEALFELPEEAWVAEAGGENWDGFRKAVEESSLPNKAKILELIDSDLDPDKKEHKISKYSKDYKVIMNEIYPMLRRTDYKVMYTVRSYTTVEEVREILNTKPWNLSLKEFFLAADGLEPGTAEFNKVFQLAAMVYPDEPVAQINAANAAMAMGALDLAQEHLDKAGDSPEARYTKGVLAALREDWETAAKYFSSAQLSGVTEAGEALETVEAILKQLQP